MFFELFFSFIALLVFLFTRVKYAMFPIISTKKLYYNQDSVSFFDRIYALEPQKNKKTTYAYEINNGSVANCPCTRNYNAYNVKYYPEEDLLYFVCKSNNNRNVLVRIKKVCASSEKDCYYSKSNAYEKTSIWGFPIFLASTLIQSIALYDPSFKNLDPIRSQINSKALPWITLVVLMVTFFIIVSSISNLVAKLNELQENYWYNKIRNEVEQTNGIVAPVQELNQVVNGYPQDQTKESAGFIKTTQSYSTYRY